MRRITRPAILVAWTLAAACLVDRVAAQPAGPTAPPATYLIGQAVEVREGTVWSPATVKAHEGRRVQIVYADGTIEWVAADRLREPTVPAADPNAPKAAEGPIVRPRAFGINTAVEVKCEDVWRPAHVKNTRNGWHVVVYDGGGEMLEWVEPWRIRRAGDKEYDVGDVPTHDEFANDRPAEPPTPKPGPPPDPTGSNLNFDTSGWDLLSWVNWSITPVDASHVEQVVIRATVPWAYKPAPLVAAPLAATSPVPLALPAGDKVFEFQQFGVFGANAWTVQVERERADHSNRDVKQRTAIARVIDLASGQTTFRGELSPGTLPLAISPDGRRAVGRSKGDQPNLQRRIDVFDLPGGSATTRPADANADADRTPVDPGVPQSLVSFEPFGGRSGFRHEWEFQERFRRSVNAARNEAARNAANRGNRANGNAPANTNDPSAKTADAPGGPPVPPPDPVTAAAEVCFVDADHLVVHNGRGVLRGFNVAKRGVVLRWELKLGEAFVPGKTITVAPDGKTICLCTVGGLMLFDGATGDCLGRLDFPNASRLGPPTFRPDGKRLAVMNEGVLLVYDLEHGAPLAAISTPVGGHGAGTPDGAASPFSQANGGSRAIWLNGDAVWIESNGDVVDVSKPVIIATYFRAKNDDDRDAWNRAPLPVRTVGGRTYMIANIASDADVKHAKDAFEDRDGLTLPRVLASWSLPAPEDAPAGPDAEIPITRLPPGTKIRIDFSLLEADDATKAALLDAAHRQVAARGWVEDPDADLRLNAETTHAEPQQQVFNDTIHGGAATLTISQTTIRYEMRNNGRLIFWAEQYHRSNTGDYYLHEGESAQQIADAQGHGDPSFIKNVTLPDVVFNPVDRWPGGIPSRILAPEGAPAADPKR